MLHCSQLSRCRCPLSASQHMAAKLDTTHEHPRLRLVCHPSIRLQPVQCPCHILLVLLDQVRIYHSWLPLGSDQNVIEVRPGCISYFLTCGIDVPLQQRWTDVDALRNHPPLPQSAWELNARHPSTFLRQCHLVECVLEVDCGEQLACCHLRREVLCERQGIAVGVDHLVRQGVVADASPLTRLLLDGECCCSPGPSTWLDLPVPQPLGLQLLQSCQSLARQVDGPAHDRHSAFLEVKPGLAVTAALRWIGPDGVPEHGAYVPLEQTLSCLRCHLPWELILCHDDTTNGLQLPCHLLQGLRVLHSLRLNAKRVQIHNCHETEAGLHLLHLVHGVVGLSAERR